MSFDPLQRRQALALIGATAAVWPLATRAQQHPVVGFLISASAQGYGRFMGPVRQGLKEAGYVDGQNLKIEYRWADYHYDRLPELAADLVGRQVAVIFTTGSVVSAIAAKAATSTIPIVFANGSDPVRYGLVASLNRPGGNATGVSFYNSGLGPKRIELLRELVPKASVIAVLVNPNNPNAEPDSKDIQEGGRSIGVRIEFVNASSERELDEAFEKVRQLQAQALMVHIDALFQAQNKQIVALAERHAIPAMYPSGGYARAGGLITYGTDVDEMDRQAGIYVGKILQGTKPADLPILQPTKFQLTLNLKTAKALGLTVPLIMQMTADEVIE